MRIIKEGKLPQKTCENCESVLEYVKEDVKTGEEPTSQFINATKRFIVCPVCKEKIYLNKTI